MKRPNIPVLAQDKANHLIWCLIIFLAVAAASLLVLHSPAGRAIVHGFVASSAIAVFWEFFQKATKTGEPDAKDALAGIAGAALGALAMGLPLLVGRAA